MPLSAAQRDPAQSSKPASEFHGWRIETFGPVAVASGDDVRLSSATGQGGMVFRRSLAADVSYRLTIAGQSRSGQTTVRLTLGQSQPQWLPAPNGQKVITFTGHQSVEVVVYSDTAYEYRLQDLEIEECDQCAQPVVFNGWQVEPFGDIESASSAGSLALASAGNTGGLVFRRSIDSGKTYRLHIAGKPLSGGTTVRLTTGRAEPKWFPAPNGANQLTVSASDSLEVVVYGDAAYSYRLETLTIDECATCLTDRQLASLILAEVPTLRDVLERNRKAAARALLNWTSNVVNLGIGDGADAATAREYEFSAAQAYQELWSEPGVGTACGGFADFFAKVLQLFGFEAFTVDFGYAGTGMTHVTTVTVVDGQLYILDPTFNGAYVNPTSGELVRLDDVLRTRQPVDVGHTLKVGPIARGVVYAASTDEAVLRLMSNSRLLSNVGVTISQCETARASATGDVRRVCRNVPYDAQALQTEWRDQLKKLQLQWSDDMFLNLMRHRVLSFSATRPEIKQQFLDTLSANGIPFGPL